MASNVIIIHYSYTTLKRKYGEVTRLLGAIQVNCSEARRWVTRSSVPTSGGHRHFLYGRDVFVFLPW